ncbi:Uncharacterised protein [Mycobacteroides abscessus subsp. abscessus]|nr:Uncharacterised protein [Mycobacteroides abscessus subsp. abscessus]SKV52562.1 Uncharacterised protein [Mycobacteroides abscessus subsp. massiliense]SHU09951.1 Uncharacterised protein [Mycobacteroides abscessus subsp. abscessus]SHW46533.1 Uncharacterised protein [Mycobacteroides abscessus subsp. abscessus]SHW47305.1 Uncharacterised protein [Mycobacteroides abscessus subsp. abscessus]
MRVPPRIVDPHQVSRFSPTGGTPPFAVPDIPSCQCRLPDGLEPVAWAKGDGTFCAPEGLRRGAAGSTINAMTSYFDSGKQRNALRDMLAVAADLEAKNLSPRQAADRAAKILNELAGERISGTQQAIAELAADLEKSQTTTPEFVEKIADSIRQHTKNMNDTDERIAKRFE